MRGSAANIQLYDGDDCQGMKSVTINCGAIGRMACYLQTELSCHMLQQADPEAEDGL